MLEGRESNSSHEECNDFDHQQGSRKAIPNKCKQKKQKWMTDENLRMTEQRRKVKINNPSKYRKLDRGIKQECIEAKEEIWNERHEGIKQEIKRNPIKVHKNPQDNQTAHLLEIEST